MNNILYTNEVSLKNFQQLEVRINPHQQTAWLYFNPQPRSCFTLTLVKELCDFQTILKNHEGRLPCNGKLVDIDYTVLASRHPVFSFGGDLNYFIECIENNDRYALKIYVKYCIDAMYDNYTGRDFDITTISLVHGSALGGGFEAALCTHVTVAERSTNMGLPETLFNLFPGMGAYQLLTQRVSPVLAEKMMLNGRLYSAEELYALGIIDFLVEDGEGKAAIDSYIRINNKRKKAMAAIRKVRRLVDPIDYQQLLNIGDIWVDTAFNLSEKDLRMMQRLVRSQEKYTAQDNNISLVKVTAS